MSTENNATAADTTTGAAQDEGYKVHIGNLPFAVTQEQVQELVAPIGGDVLKVELPTRFGRPAGYAFVHFKDEASATAAVEKLDGTDFQERKLKVAKGRSEDEVAERRKEAHARRDAAKAAKAEKEVKNAEAKEANGTEGEGEKTRKKRTPKPRSRRRQPGEEEDGAEANGDASDSAPKPRRRSSKKGGRIDDAGAGEETLVEKDSKPRKKREPRMELTGEQSKTTIFVANLPFSVDDDALAAIFTNLSINVKSAKVVTGLRRVKPGARPFRGSKGFGFVEVADSAQQQEAVDKVNGSLVADRSITAKIANEMREIEKEEVKEGETA